MNDVVIRVNVGMQYIPEPVAKFFPRLFGFWVRVRVRVRVRGRDRCSG